MTTDVEQQGASLEDDLAGAIEETEGEAPPEQEAPEAPPEPSRLDPHPMWKKELREVFDAWGSHDEEQGTPRYPDGSTWQELWLNQYKDTQAHVTQKEQEAAEFKRQLEQFHGYANQWNQVLSPYQSLAARLGVDEHTLVRNSLGLLQRLREDPQAALVELAREAGIDINQIGAAQPYVSETEAQVQRELRDLKRQIAQRDASMSQERIHQLQAQQHAHQVQVTQQVETFETETDGDGNLKRPHIGAESPFREQVRNTMAMLIHGERQVQGPQFKPDLEAVYSKACTLIPEIAQADAAAKAKKEAEAKAAKAKKEQAASARVSGTHTGAKPPQRSLQDELSAEYDKNAA